MKKRWRMTAPPGLTSPRDMTSDPIDAQVRGRAPSAAPSVTSKALASSWNAQNSSIAALSSPPRPRKMTKKEKKAQKNRPPQPPPQSHPTPPRGRGRGRGRRLSQNYSQSMAHQQLQRHNELEFPLTTPLPPPPDSPPLPHSQSEMILPTRGPSLLPPPLHLNDYMSPEKKVLQSGTPQPASEALEILVATQKKMKKMEKKAAAKQLKEKKRLEKLEVRRGSSIDLAVMDPRGAAVMKGWCTKRKQQIGLSRWRRRYLALHNTSLYYFDGPEVYSPLPLNSSFSFFFFF